MHWAIDPKAPSKQLLSNLQNKLELQAKALQQAKALHILQEDHSHCMKQALPLQAEATSSQRGDRRQPAVPLKLAAEAAASIQHHHCQALPVPTAF